jgi:hypothetical protein
MDAWKRILDIDMAKPQLVAFGSTKIGNPFETTKRRPRTISSCENTALVRLIIPPPRRDRWFKSSPRNQFLCFESGNFTDPVCVRRSLRLRWTGGREDSCWHGELVGSWFCRALVSEEDAGRRSTRLVCAALRSGRGKLDLLFRAGPENGRALVCCHTR